MTSSAFTLTPFTTCRLTAIGIAALILPAIMMSCDSHPRDPQLEWGWVTNCTGPVFRKFGATDAGPVFRINDQLVVAVPKKNRPYANSIDAEPRECRQIDDLPGAHFLSFVIWGNWSAGYKPEDVPSVDGMEAKYVRPDLVSVRIEPEVPSKLSAEERQEPTRIAEEGLSHLYAGTCEIVGLTCRIPKLGSQFDCSGRRGSADTDITRLDYTDVYTPVAELDKTRVYTSSFVQIQADYVSSRYGGIHVYWKAVTSDISHWRDIDAEVFNQLAEWNLTNNTDAQSGR